MSEPAHRTQASATRLVLIPGVITLGVTLLRLAGELQRWPETFFNRTMGGSVIAITWLPPVFGIYFALKLANSGRPPKSYLGAIKYALLGLIVLVVCAFAPARLGIEHGFYGRLLYGWFFFSLAAVVTYRGWPELFKTLLAYGYAARIPVALIMLLAMRANWGTHYDAVPPHMPPLGPLAKYLWLAFFPQLMLWVAYTVLAGMLFGAIVMGIAFLVKIERGSAV